ncbi:hypothetical protein BH20ACT15_BH20ACT15_03740 [soil metagenome]
MAARRLLVLMVILLGVSTILAASLPDRVRDPEQGTESAGSTGSEKVAETETQATSPEAAAPGASLPAAQDSDAQAAADCDVVTCVTINAERPEVTIVKAPLGGQLALTVRSRKADTVEIPALGQIDVVSADAPATFDLLIDSAGTYGIGLIRADRLIGRIEVTRGSGADSP